MRPRRSLAKLIRLTPDEFAEIERRARAAGLLPARFLRDAALARGASSSSSAPTASPELLHTLGAIGAKLKTLTRSTSDEQTLTQIGRVLADLVAALRQLTRGDHP